MEDEELKSHIKAIADWASKDTKNRCVFIVCSEYKGVGLQQYGSLMGRTDKNILGLIGVAVKEPNYDMILKDAARGLVDKTFVKRLMDSVLDKSVKESDSDNKSNLDDRILNILKEMFEK